MKSDPFTGPGSTSDPNQSTIAEALPRRDADDVPDAPTGPAQTNPDPLTGPGTTNDPNQSTNEDR